MTDSKTMLSPKEQNLFQRKIDSLQDALEAVGVVFRENWSCCQSCGHAEMEAELKDEEYEFDTTYIFYHQQEGDRLRDGAETLHLCHSILPGDLEAVLEVLEEYGSNWKGEADKTIEIPFLTNDEMSDRIKALLAQKGATMIMTTNECDGKFQLNANDLLRKLGFTHYKLRGECRPDFIDAIQLWKKDGYSIQRANVSPLCLEVEGLGSVPIPDFDATFYSNATKEQLIASLKKGQDLHVMYETLEPIENYTGER
jgi:hypothetical protein